MQHMFRVFWPSRRNVSVIVIHDSFSQSGDDVRADDVVQS
jgi:hypothetical protein